MSTFITRVRVESREGCLLSHRSSLGRPVPHLPSHRVTSWTTVASPGCDTCCSVWSRAPFILLSLCIIATLREHNQASNNADQQVLSPHLCFLSLLYCLVVKFLLLLNVMLNYSSALCLFYDLNIYF